jgi:uncharacterized protein
MKFVKALPGLFPFTGVRREEGIMSQGDEAIRKGSIMGALTLYLDFINLFLMLLRFFGGSRN